MWIPVLSVEELTGSRISAIAKALGYQNSEMFENDGTLLVEHPWLLFS